MDPRSLALAMTESLDTALAAARERAAPALAADLAAACAALVEGGTETARLVALTNLAGTAADPGIESDILQVQHGGVDFRTIYKRTTRPMMEALALEAAVKWKPSADPYVSNPYREERVDDAWVTRRGRKLPGAAELNAVLQAAKADPGCAAPLLATLLRHELARLHALKIDYPIPPRLTVEAVAGLLGDWLDGGMGGKRLETVAVALLRHVGVELQGMWTDVTSHHVNAPSPYDALCYAGAAVHTVVEVKDQPVTRGFLGTLADQMLEHGAQRGLLFTRSRWLPTGPEAEETTTYLRGRSLLGLRIQILDLEQAAASWLALIDADDDALPRFLRQLTRELDQNGEAADRMALAALLKEI